MRPLFLAALLGSSLWALPARAQISIPAPRGWTTQDKPGGAHVFSPPDLRAGEVYSLTVYDSASMNGKTLEEYLRASAGPVQKAPGKLMAPLQIKVEQGRIVSGVGVYSGPNGTKLAALFVGVTLDGGANIHLERTLFSLQSGLSDRYSAASQSVMSALVERAKAEAGDDIEVTPSAVSEKLKTVGGELVPGVYAGNQYRGDELNIRFHVYIFANGEYLLCDENDENLTKRFFDELSGQVNYNRNSGKLNIDWTTGLGTYGDDGWCYYGKDASGKPAIYAQDRISRLKTSLTWIGPPTKRLSKSAAEEAETAATAEKNRFKWVVAPGKGVQTAQIAAILCNSQFMNGSTTTDTYLLLKDGSVYADLPVPPDELDTQKSKQKEPDKWGKWRKGVKGDYLVSWNGAKYENLPGFAVVPAPSQTKLQGRWGAGRSTTGFVSSFALWGVTFGKNGRFSKDSRGGSSSIGLPDMNGDVAMTSSGYDENGSYAGASGPGYAVASEAKRKNPNGNREGDYSLSGYVLILRYDNGKVARLPFFFFDKTQSTLYFEGSTMSKDDGK